MAGLEEAGRYLLHSARLMVGLPDYGNYVEHMRITHPEQVPMTYEEFFRERQEARTDWRIPWLRKPVLMKGSPSRAV